MNALLPNLRRGLLKKPLNQWSHSEYMEYIASLYKETKAGGQAKAGYSAYVNKKGTLVITIRRDPKYLTEEEIGQIAKDHGMEKREVWLKVGERKIPVWTHEQAREIKKKTEDLPW